tara:strand:- start:47 stop:508 length:462 start_codon:yes stop_codon:yes gene_type:complete
MNKEIFKGGSKVTDAFGYFPTFHDAEVIWVTLNRNSSPGVEWPVPTLEFLLHGWEMTSEVNEKGFYVLTKHHLVHFKFSGIDHMNLQHFNHQNAIFELSITEIEKPTDHAKLEVQISHAHGLNGAFRAVSGEVLSVTPCDADGFPTQSANQSE